LDGLGMRISPSPPNRLIETPLWAFFVVPPEVNEKIRGWHEPRPSLPSIMTATAPG
jgi:hypothetical protein